MRPSSAPILQQAPSPGSVKCLIVDDLEENLLALSALLRRKDVEILTARSGAAALELLLAHEVALAFLDVQMPDMDGFELAELMRGSERTRHVPIIFVTAGSRDQHRLFKGYETGAVDFIHKPIDAHILASKADVFFQLYRQKQQLSLKLDELAQTLRLNEMLTAVLGHDLRNPLGAIMTAADLLELRADEASNRKIAARIRSSGLRMRRMIEDLLDLSRARLAGGIPIQCAPVDLGAVTQRVLAEHQAMGPDRALHMRVHGELRGEWDPERLAQVLSNLVGNALQHGDPGEAVVIELDGTDEVSVSLTISNGGTIPSAIRQRLFDPFRTTERGAQRSSGLGLGMYIVQQIVLAHGGTVRVKSEDERRRVTFGIDLPRHATQSDSPQGPLENGRAVTDPRHG